MGDTEFSRSPVTRLEFRGAERAVQSTLARVEAIAAENLYEETTEAEFRDSSERINAHVVLISLFLVTIEGAVVAWQILHLRGLFRRKKLI